MVSPPEQPQGKPQTGIRPRSLTDCGKNSGGLRTCREAVWRCRPSDFPAVCGPDRWCGPPPASSRSSSPSGSGGCASARGTASRYDWAGVWRWATSASRRTYGPARSPAQEVTSQHNITAYKRVVVNSCVQQTQSDKTIPLEASLSPPHELEPTSQLQFGGLSWPVSILAGTLVIFGQNCDIYSLHCESLPSRPPPESRDL